MPSPSLKCLLAVVGKGGTPAVDAPSLASQASSPPCLVLASFHPLSP